MLSAHSLRYSVRLRFQHRHRAPAHTCLTRVRSAHTAQACPVAEFGQCAESISLLVRALARSVCHTHRWSTKVVRGCEVIQPLQLRGVLKSSSLNRCTVGSFCFCLCATTQREHLAEHLLVVRARQHVKFVHQRDRPHDESQADPRSLGPTIPSPPVPPVNLSMPAPLTHLTGRYLGLMLPCWKGRTYEIRFGLFLASERRPRSANARAWVGVHERLHRWSSGRFGTVA